MTTSYWRGKITLSNIFSMYLGLWEGIRLRKQEDYESSSQKIDLVEQGIKKMNKGYGLVSIKEHFNIDTREWMERLDKIITELKGSNPNLEKQTQYIESILPKIKKALPLVPHY